MSGRAHDRDHEVDAELLGWDTPLPQDLTSFVGRDEEIRTARALLLDEERRLVTLVGIGGVGKSRLLERLPRVLHGTGAFPDGITLVRLTDLPASADHVASTIAHRVQLLDNASEPALPRLIKHFRTRRALLLLDNCEHLVVGDAPLTQLLNSLLRSTENLSVVATSVVKVGAVGERVLKVSPLSVREGLEVLVDRAAAVGAPIAEEEYPLAECLCEATDGIPLAIELAAGRLDIHTLQELVDRAKAGDLLRALVDGTSEQRNHRTMADNIAGSYELLSESEQLLLALLSVFRGGFDLDAAAAVVSDVGVDAAGLDTAIVRLVRLSLVVAENYDGRKRYRLMEIIRQFAQQRVHDGPVDARALLEAHNRYYLDLSAHARREWFGPREPFWMRAISVDLPNFRTVQERLLSHPETAAQGLELALNATATRAFVFGGRLNESRRMLEAGLAKHPAEPSLSQVAALSLTLWVAVLQGEQELADCLLGQVTEVAGELECVETFGPLLYARGSRVGLNASTPAQTREALGLLARAEKALQEDGEPGDEFMAALFLAIVTAFGGSRDAAFAESARVLAAARAARSEWCISWGLWVSALAELMHGDDAAKATRLAQGALGIQVGIGDKWGWATWLLALCAINAGEFELGSVLLGAADREQSTTQTSVSGLLSFLRAQQRFVAAARSAMGDGAFEEHVASGFAMSAKEAFARAMEPAQSVAPPSAAKVESKLSERELEVARLIAEGKTNGEIATVLFLSERTVEGHVGKINGKLGTRNRTEITGYVMKNLQTTWR